jgi:hypothetical protein
MLPIVAPMTSGKAARRLSPKLVPLSALRVAALAMALADPVRVCAT